MSVEQSKAIVRRYIEEVLNRGNLAATDEVIASGFVMHPSRPGQKPGREGVKQFAATQRAVAPDWHITIEDMVAEGDRVAVRATGYGTPAQAFFGIPASSKPLTVPWITIYRLADGMIVEAWVAGRIVSSGE